jgi:uroporphyrinogen decarboxylase
MNFKLPEDRILIIPLLGAPGIKLSRTTLKENLTDWSIQLKTIRLLMERFQPDGVFPFMDLTVEAEALGSEINFPEYGNPYVTGHFIETEDDLKVIQSRYKGLSGRMPVFIKVVEKLAKDYSNFSIIKGAYAIGPFTLAGQMMGISKLCMNVILNAGLAHKLIEFTTKVIKDYIKAFLDAGAEIVAILEPSAVMLSPDQFDEFSGKYLSYLVKELKAPLILHICGNSSHLLKKMPHTGAKALSLDSPVNLKEASKVVSEEIILMGNLAPVKIFLQSTPDEVTEATMALLDETKDIKNFILSSGCDIPLETPLENIEAFMKAGRKFGAKTSPLI